MSGAGQGQTVWSGGTGLAAWWQTRPERERLALLSLLLLGAVFAVYGRTLGYGFVNYDDPPYVTENPPVARGLSAAGVRWAFTTGHTGMWHPMTWLSHQLDVSLFGMNPAGHHLMNVWLHGATVVLLFVFLQGATRDTSRSLAVALGFALHPLNVEAVAWVSQRKSLLSALFFMLTLLAWLGYVRGRRGASGLAAIFFALGLLAKPMVVTLPAVLLLLDVWPFRRTGLGWKRLVGEKWPFFLLAMASTLLLLHPPFPVDTASPPRVWSLHVAQLGLSNYLHYLGLLAWPWPMGVLYPEPGAIAAWAWGGGLVVLLGLSGWLAVQVRDRPEVLVGWLWFIGMILPVVGFVPIGAPQGMADRYVYLPAIGLFIGLAWAWRGNARAGALVTGVVAMTWALVAFAQTGYWRDSLTLWTHTAAFTPVSPTRLLNQGAALVSAGRYAEAEACFRQLEQLDPREPRASLNLAVIYERLDRLPEAVQAAARSVQLQPFDFRARSNYASLLTSAGQGRAAEEQLLVAIGQNPDFADAWLNLGIVRAQSGRLAEAVTCFERAVAIRPDAEAARQNLALAREQLRQSQQSPAPRSAP